MLQISRLSRILLNLPVPRLRIEFEEPLPELRELFGGQLLDLGFELLAPARSREILARIPARRWGTPDDLKGAVVFLACPASAYVHATTLTVDGGWLSQ